MTSPRHRSSPSVGSRRDFLRASAGAAAALPALSAGVHLGGRDDLRVGLVGCGGRGTGAAVNALRADSGVRLVAMADLFSDHLQRSLSNLQKTKDVAERVDVPPEHQFVGFDGLERMLDAGVDVVLLASTPHFRPSQVELCAERGVHMFVEKPVAVDAPGVRRVREACKRAVAKGKNVVSGLCYRYHNGRRAIIDRIHGGAIGDIMSIDVNYITGALWHRGRKPDWSEMEFQQRNWLYWTWLSGDHIAEQHIHSLDVALWLMGDVPPERCLAIGGRQVRTGEEYGNVCDHFCSRYEFGGGVKVFAACRQMPGCAIDVSDNVRGSKGHAEIFQHTTHGEAGEWQWESDNTSMYQNEHDQMFAAIRAGNVIDNSEYMCNSTLMAIMGRMSAYTGKVITWQQAVASEEVLAPAGYAWGAVPAELSEIAVPGVTRFV